MSEIKHSISESNLTDIVKLEDEVLIKDGFTVRKLNDRVSLICRFQCPKCDYTYFTKKQLDLHISRNHQTKQEPVKDESINKKKELSLDYDKEVELEPED